MPLYEQGISTLTDLFAPLSTQFTEVVNTGIKSLVQQYITGNPATKESISSSPIVLAEMLAERLNSSDDFMASLRTSFESLLGSIFPQQA